MLLIKNGHIKTMAENEFANGQILIGDDGTILEIAETVTAPRDAKVIDAGGRLVTPGCVEAQCHIGLKNQGFRWEGNDLNEETDPITPQIRAIDSINPHDEAFSWALQGGVTTACTEPGSSNVVGGICTIIKMYGDCVENMILKDSAAMKCAFGEDPKRTYSQSMKKAPMTRMGTAAILRELLFQTKQYIHDKQDDKNPKFDMKLEAMIPVVEGKLPLKAHAYRADDIFTAIRITKEFGLNLIIEHCTDGTLIADELEKEGYPVLVGPNFTNKSAIELRNLSFDTPHILQKAGILISIITDSFAPGRSLTLQYLPLCAALAVRHGLERKEAWKAITINPAKTLGIDNRVGSLEVGKDGDVVIWTNDPMETVGAKSWVTVINGKVIYACEI